MTINSFEELDIWKDARELAKVIRLLTKREPFSKDFKLCNQINSSAGSVMDNIAEGFERDGHKEFIQFLYIAKASNGETRSQSYRAFDAEFISEEELNDILSRTQNLRIKIISLINYLKKSDFKGNKFKP
jgi:four helix bundle protein